MKKLLVIFMLIGLALSLVWGGYYLGMQRNPTSPYPQNDEEAREKLQAAFISYWKDFWVIRKKAHNGQLKTKAEKLSYYYFAARGLSCVRSGDEETDFCFPDLPLVEWCDVMKKKELKFVIGFRFLFFIKRIMLEMGKEQKELFVSCPPSLVERLFRDLLQMENLK